jgi:hypothetical protein
MTTPGEEDRPCLYGESYSPGEDVGLPLKYRNLKSLIALIVATSARDFSMIVSDSDEVLIAINFKLFG